MPLFYKVIILALIGALAAPFIMKKPDGTPMMTFKQFMPDASKSIDQLTAMGKTQPQLYRWKDEKGHWQYSDSPHESAQGEKFQVQATINAMKTIELPEGFGEPKKKEPSEPGDTDGFNVPVTTAPLSKVPKMLEDIDGIQQKFDNRQQQLDAATR
ncbi:MAG: DUF4124 domain-containing protein [Bermanella sp.]